MEGSLAVIGALIVAVDPMAEVMHCRKFRGASYCRSRQMLMLDVYMDEEIQ